MNEERRVQLVAELDTTRTREGFQEIGQQASTMANAVSSAGERAQRAVSSIGSGADQSAEKVEAAQRNLIGSIQRTTAAMQAGSRTSAEYYETLARQRGVDPAALTPYLNQLRAIESQTRSVGVSAAQTAAALRGVPAQFTDIITSLQGGQNPLTVILQQGGQLRDMFGSAGAAARALGGYVVGLINPFTLAAAAAAALAVAYHEGSKEADAYAKALILTGNAAGSTADQLSEMSRQIRASGVSTRGAAAEALAALAGTGKVGSDNLQNFATVAVKVQKSIGQSVQDTAKDFAELNNSPLRATEKLNEQLNYLTESTYKQIKTLQDLGKQDEAGEVAQKAYADALASRADRIKASLGTLEKSWAGVKDWAKSAWDAMLDVGREDTMQEKLDKVQARIAARTPKATQKSLFGGGTGFDSSASNLSASQGLDDLRTDASDLSKRIASQQILAMIEANEVKSQQAKTEWDKVVEGNLTRRTLMERELEAIENKGIAAGKEKAEILTEQNKARQKYSDIFNDGINSQIEAIKRRGAVEDEVAKRSLDALNTYKTAGITNEREYIQATEELDQAAFAREKARLQEELKLTAGKQNSQKDQAALRGQIAALDEKSLSRRLQYENELFALEVKETRQAANNYADLIAKRDDYNESLLKQIRGQQDSNAQIGMSSQQIADLNVALAEEAARREDVQAAILDTTAGREQEADKLRLTASRIRELAKAQRDGLLKQEDFDRQKTFWTSVDDAARQAFLSIGEGGKSVAQRLRDSFKSIFFDWLYQMTVKKWIINIGTSLGVPAGVFGSTANAANVIPGADGGSALGQIGSIASIANSAKNLYSLITAGVGTTIGGGIASIGSTLGIQSLQGFGMGLSGGGGIAAQGSALLPGFSSGAAIAPYLGPALGIAGGVGIGQLISGRYSAIGNNSLTATAIGTAIGTFLLPGLGSIVGGAIGGLVNRAFGRGPKETTASGVTGTFSGDTFTGQQFADWIQKGGWFRSDKTGTDVSSLTADQQTAFDTAFKAIKDSTKSYAEALGVSTDVITGYSKQIKLTLTQDQAENEKLIADMFAGIGNELANALVPNLSEFSQAGEAASVTLQRVTGDFVAVGASLAAIGVDADKAFGAVGVASLSAREKLIALAGGIDSLVNQTAYFAQNFLTDAQRIAPVQKQVTDALAALGYSSLTTVDQFRDAVLDLTSSGALATEAGQKAYEGLLAIAPQFKQVADYLDQVKKSADDLAAQQAQQAVQLAQQLADAFSAAKSVAQNAFSALSSAVDRERAAIASRYSGIVGSLSTAIDGLGQSISRTKDIIALTKDAIQTFALPGQETQVGTDARRRLADIAHGSSLPDIDVIRQAIAGATQVNPEDFASQFDLVKATSQTRNDLLAIQDSAGRQLTGEEHSLAVVQQWKSEYETQQTAELDALNSQLERAQAQIDAINGVNTSVLTVRDALTAFASSISNAVSAQSAVGGGGAASGIASTSTTPAKAANPDSFVTSFWENTALDFARNGAIGGAIVSAPSRAVSPEVSNTMQGVEKRLDSLEQALTSGMMNIAAHTKSTADTLDQFNLQGLPAER